MGGTKVSTRPPKEPEEDDELSLSVDGDDEFLNDSGSDGDEAMGGGGAFSKAFNKIMGKRLRDEGPEGPILQKNKKLQKELDEAKVLKDQRAASRQAKLELKARGHVMPKRPGDDPDHDAFEKALIRVATKGVVRLFNAVSKAQKSAGGDKSKKMSRADFLAELKGEKGAAAAGGATKGAATGPGTGPIGGVIGGDSGVGGGWDVLDGAGLMGTGNLKMKDWDKDSDAGSGSDAGLGSDGEGGGIGDLSDVEEDDDDLSEEEGDPLASSGDEDEGEDEGEDW